MPSFEHHTPAPTSHPPHNPGCNPCHHQHNPSSATQPTPLATSQHHPLIEIAVRITIEIIRNLIC